MVTEENRFVQDPPELSLDELNPLVPVADISAPSVQPRPWGYFIAGMSLTLLAVALGAVLGYLARPALDTAPAASVITFTQAPAAEDKALSPTPTIMDFVLSDARHFQGSNEAPVTVVEFSDFKCPYCGRFSTETLPQLRQTYVDTGQVRFVFKQFAILGPESNRAAEATECAMEQGKFWEYHDEIYADQAATHSTLNDEQLANLAGKVGLESSAFADCLAAGRYAGQVQRESQAVGAMGMRSTPSFLINGVFLVGAQPFEAFQQVIEEQLQASTQGTK